MDEDIAAIEVWAQAFGDPMALAQDVVSNYLSHSPEIMANFSKAKTDFSEGNFYSAG